MLCEKTKMIKFKPLETILQYWAAALPYKVRIHLFGGYLKHKPDRLVSDIDISLEFLHPFSKDERREIWEDCHSLWEMALSKSTCETIHLCLFEEDDSPKLKQYLKDGSVLIYDWNEMHQRDEELSNICLSKK